MKGDTLISVRRAYKKLGITRQELKERMKELQIQPVLKEERWEFLTGADFMRLKQATQHKNLEHLSPGELIKNLLADVRGKSGHRDQGVR